MTEIEKTIKHFENERNMNYVVLDGLKQEIESGKINGSTLIYDNRAIYYNLALSALREMQEREKGCECCSETLYTYKYAPYSNDAEMYDTVSKKFCPNCGRKLKEAQHE